MKASILFAAVASTALLGAVPLVAEESTDICDQNPAERNADENRYCECRSFAQTYGTYLDRANDSLAGMPLMPNSRIQAPSPSTLAKISGWQGLICGTDEQGRPLDPQALKPPAP